MLSRTATVLSTLHGVQDFMTTNASALGTLNTSASRQDLDAIESTLSAHASSQTGSASGRTAAIARQRVFKNTLVVKYLRPIAAIAAAKLNQSPDFAELKMPKSVRSTPQLLAAATAMGTTAATYADTFIAAGMAPTFVADLAAAVNDVKQGEVAKSSSVASRTGSSAALTVATRQATRVVKQLDALIVPQLANDPGLLAKWKSVKKFTGRAPAISAAAADAGQTVSSSPAPAPASATAPAPAEASAPAVTPTVTPIAPATTPVEQPPAQPATVAQAA